MYNERGVRQPTQPDAVTFDTDFGVRFGVLVGFDLAMPEPANTLLKQGITHFVHPTLWINEVPFSTGKVFRSPLSIAGDFIIPSSCLARELHDSLHRFHPDMLMNYLLICSPSNAT